MWFCKDQTYVLNGYDGTIISFKSSRVKLTSTIPPQHMVIEKNVLALLKWANFRLFHLAFTTRLILTPQVKELMWGLYELSSMSIFFSFLFFFFSPFQYTTVFKEMPTRWFCGSSGPKMNFSYSLS